MSAQKRNHEKVIIRHRRCLAHSQIPFMAFNYFIYLLPRYLEILNQNPRCCCTSPHCSLKTRLRWTFIGPQCKWIWEPPNWLDYCKLSLQTFQFLHWPKKELELTLNINISSCLTPGPGVHAGTSLINVDLNKIGILSHTPSLIFLSVLASCLT